MKPLIIILWILGWETLCFYKSKYARSLNKFSDTAIATAAIIRSLSGFAFAWWLWRNIP